MSGRSFSNSWICLPLLELTASLLVFIPGTLCKRQVWSGTRFPPPPLRRTHWQELRRDRAEHRGNRGNAIDGLAANCRCDCDLPFSDSQACLREAYTGFPLVCEVSPPSLPKSHPSLSPFQIIRQNGESGLLPLPTSMGSRNTAQGPDNICCPSGL